MNEDRWSRLGWLSGAAFVVLELGGFAIGSGAGRASVTLADPAPKIVKAFAEPVGSGVWIGAYMELLALAAFAIFAAWLFRSLHSPLGTAGLLGASAYIAITAVSLVIGDVLEYRAGHGMGAQEIQTLFYIQSGLFITSWGIAGGMLAIAPVTGWLRRTALAIAVLSFAGMAFPKGELGQFAAMLFLVWTFVASITLARRASTVRSTTTAVAAHA